MASGLSGRNNSGSKGFDFATEDILCSYENYGNQDSSKGSHSDPGIGSNSNKEFHTSRMSRSSMFPALAYSPPEDSFNQEVISTVDKTMKKYTDNIMRFLEGLSSRLSQLELYCYNLDKSIGEMRSDLGRDHGEADLKLKSLDKHLQEVHRSVQILRDKQELADAQKELAKLQLAQKESSYTGHSQQEERASPPASDPKKSDITPDMDGQQLALALPHQVTPQPSVPARHMEQQQPVAPPPPPSVAQPQAYYLPPVQMQNPPAPPAAPPQPTQGQYPPSDQYRAPQMQDVSRVAPQPAQPPVNQAPQVHQLPQYQQQWAQQLPQQVTQPQSTMQPQIRASSQAVYPPYLPSQPANPTPPEALQNSIPMQAPYSGISQLGANRAETMPYGFGGPGRTVQQQQQQPPTQQFKSSFGVQPSDGYSSSGNAYMMYEGEAGRSHHPPQQPHFQQGSYPQTSVPLQGPQPSAGPNLPVRPPQFMHNHPYNELIDKLVSMGYRGDHVVSVIQRLEQSGQPVDFNTVLDRLNGNSTGGSQRGWSG
ncbi:Actin cytoskeleton-regulatory complex protein like [Actinidia chinensis var. chinensis]|uniref:Actin cytoskeleton-regulatory complex protein like n=1 Tax=Actinidia chinensis var. chinensis TaxID=1590841 RepID=A0A2R6QTL5_ACTCC|nr:Actin cytoskeleton-regulatory complex protein like [Actinidia chinensis var. chinensis]